NRSLGIASSDNVPKGPEPGDHIFFTGLVWSPTFTELFAHLARKNIKFSVLVHDIIPIERPELVGEDFSRAFSAWLEITVRAASVIYVSSSIIRDQILRWALLSGLEPEAEIVTIRFGVHELEGSLSEDELAHGPLSTKLQLDSFVLS